MPDSPCDARGFGLWDAPLTCTLPSGHGGNHVAPAGTRWREEFLPHASSHASSHVVGMRWESAFVCPPGDTVVASPLPPPTQPSGAVYGPREGQREASPAPTLPNAPESLSDAHVTIDRATIECVLLDHAGQITAPPGHADTSLAELAHVYRDLTGFDVATETGTGRLPGRAALRDALADLRETWTARRREHEYRLTTGDGAGVASSVAFDVYDAVLRELADVLDGTGPTQTSREQLAAVEARAERDAEIAAARIAHLEQQLTERSTP